MLTQAHDLSLKCCQPHVIKVFPHIWNSMSPGVGNEIQSLLFSGQWFKCGSGSAKDCSHWVSVFDGLCKTHWFSNPSRQVCISQKATVTADANWYPCWRFQSSQKLNGCRNWARCYRCSKQSRPWLWGSDKPVNIMADCEQKGMSVCCVALQFACTKSYGNVHIIICWWERHGKLLDSVNSLGREGSAGRSKNRLETYERIRETKVNRRIQLDLLAYFHY